MESDAQKSIRKSSSSRDKKPKNEETAKQTEVEFEFFSASQREIPVTANKSLMLPPIDEPSVRYAYEMSMKVLACPKLGDFALTRAVKPEEIYALLDYAKQVFIGQPSCVEIDGPISICGDIHGQFGDLLRIFDKTGFPNRSNYLFLGDYVDRGKHCLETILLLFSYKIMFPNHFFLLRGNHECPMINKQYGFYDECMRRYKCVRVWESFQEVFSWMPLTALISERVLCMHGGISPNLNNLNLLRQFKRPNYQPESPSIEIDILWSDPTNFGKGFGPNSRGVSYVFGADVLRRCLDELKIDLVVRAHQVVQDGYEFFAGRRLVTIFSAPFYCGQFDNAAAVLCISHNLVCNFKILRPKKRSIRNRLTPGESTEKLARGELTMNF